ncbi:MAG: hypothetical protein AB7G12_07350 [Thermoanaerobaculia bacterium]
MRLTTETAELVELHELCRSGRLYDVERWIQAGRPLQLAAGAAARRRQSTALETALERQDQALILLLVANGYDLTLEPQNPLDTVLSMRRRDLLDLLIAWGADPRAACVDTLLETYDSQLFERFRELGLDFTKDFAIAHALGDHTSNKPLFGFVRRHRADIPRMQQALDIALAHHAGEGHEKGVMLCLWAGANPHSQVPWLRYLGFGEVDPEDEDRHSAVEAACSGGHAPILEKLGPNPAVDDFEELYCSAANEKVIAVLLRQKLPKDAGRVIALQVARTHFRFGEYRPVEALRALFAAGVRWQEASAEEIASSRRDMLRCSDWDFADLMRLLAADDHCSKEVLSQLARTSSLRERMKKVGLIPESPWARSAFDRSRPSRAREMLDKLGIERPKPKVTKAAPVLYRRERIGNWRREAIEIRVDRETLFERVWTVPVEKLASEWGLSGRGLAKACRRLRIPVPPRGYWARVAAGQRPRRPRLPDLPTGCAEEILVYAPRPEGAE